MNSSRPGPPSPLAHDSSGQPSPKQARLETLFWGTAQVLAIAIAVLFGVFTILAYNASEQALNQATMANQLAMLSLCAAGGQGGGGPQALVAQKGVPPPGVAAQLTDSDLCTNLLAAAAKQDLHSMANQLFTQSSSSGSPSSLASSSTSSSPSSSSSSSSTAPQSDIVQTITDSDPIVMTAYNGTGLNGTIYLTTVSTSLTVYTETIPAGVTPAAASSGAAAGGSDAPAASQISDTAAAASPTAAAASPTTTTTAPTNLPTSDQSSSSPLSSAPTSNTLQLALGIGLGVGIPSIIAIVLSIWLTVLKWRNGQQVRSKFGNEYRPLMGSRFLHLRNN